MGFEEAAIQSIRGNRGLQRKKSAFDRSASEYNSVNINIEKIPVNEARMKSLQNRSNLKELIFWVIGLIVGLVGVWFWMG